MTTWEEFLRNLRWGQRQTAPLAQGRGLWNAVASLVEQDRKRIKIRTTAITGSEDGRTRRLLDVRLARAAGEDLLYAMDPELRRVVSRGLAFVQTGKADRVVGRRGLPKFFDKPGGEAAPSREMELVTLDYKRQLELLRAPNAHEDLELCLVPLEKLNGENAQVSYCPVLGQWLCGSKNVTVNVDERRAESLEPWRDRNVETALNVCETWLRYVARCPDVDLLKTVLAGRTLVGELIGASRGRPIGYQGTDRPTSESRIHAPPMIKFFAVVENNAADGIGVPLRVAERTVRESLEMLLSDEMRCEDAFHGMGAETLRHRVEQYTNRVYAVPAELDGFVEALERLQDDVAELWNSEGSVVYLCVRRRPNSEDPEMLTQEADWHCWNVFKLKTLQYRVMRRMRERLKGTAANLGSQTTLEKEVARFDRGVAEITSMCRRKEFVESDATQTMLVEAKAIHRRLTEAILAVMDASAATGVNWLYPSVQDRVDLRQCIDQEFADFLAAGRRVSLCQGAVQPPQESDPAAWLIDRFLRLREGKSTVPRKPRGGQPVWQILPQLLILTSQPQLDQAEFNEIEAAARRVAKTLTDLSGAELAEGDEIPLWPTFAGTAILPSSTLLRKVANRRSIPLTVDRNPFNLSETLRVLHAGGQIRWLDIADDTASTACVERFVICDYSRGISEVALEPRHPLPYGVFQTADDRPPDESRRPRKRKAFADPSASKSARLGVRDPSSGSLLEESIAGPPAFNPLTELKDVSDYPRKSPRTKRLIWLERAHQAFCAPPPPEDITKSPLPSLSQIKAGPASPDRSVSESPRPRVCNRGCCLLLPAATDAVTAGHAVSQALHVAELFMGRLRAPVSGGALAPPPYRYETPSDATSISPSEHLAPSPKRPAQPFFVNLVLFLGFPGCGKSTILSRASAIVARQWDGNPCVEISNTGLPDDFRPVELADVIQLEPTPSEATPFGTPGQSVTDLGVEIGGGFLVVRQRRSTLQTSKELRGEDSIRHELVLISSDASAQHERRWNADMPIREAVQKGQRRSFHLLERYIIQTGLDGDLSHRLMLVLDKNQLPDALPGQLDKIAAVLGRAVDAISAKGDRLANLRLGCLVFRPAVDVCTAPPSEATCMRCGCPVSCPDVMTGRPCPASGLAPHSSLWSNPQTTADLFLNAGNRHYRLPWSIAALTEVYLRLASRQWHSTLPAASAELSNVFVSFVSQAAKSGDSFPHLAPGLKLDAICDLDCLQDTWIDFTSSVDNEAYKAASAEAVSIGAALIAALQVPFQPFATNVHNLPLYQLMRAAAVALTDRVATDPALSDRRRILISSSVATVCAVVAAEMTALMDKLVTGSVGIAIQGSLRLVSGGWRPSPQQISQPPPSPAPPPELGKQLSKFMADLNFSGAPVSIAAQFYGKERDSIKYNMAWWLQIAAASATLTWGTDPQGFALARLILSTASWRRPEFHVTVRYLGSDLRWNAAVVHRLRTLDSQMSKAYRFEGTHLVIVPSGLVVLAVKPLHDAGPLNPRLLPWYFEPQRRQIRPHITLATNREYHQPVDANALLAGVNQLLTGEGRPGLWQVEVNRRQPVQAKPSGGDSRGRTPQLYPLQIPARVEQHAKRIDFAPVVVSEIGLFTNALIVEVAPCIFAGILDAIRY